MTVRTHELRRRTAAVFKPFAEDCRYRAAHGGRGSGKSHEIAGRIILRAVKLPDYRGIGIRETQKSTKYSSKQLLADKIRELNAGDYFDVQESEIRVRANGGNGRIVFTGMQDHTAESIKSLESFDDYWVTEAQQISNKSLRMLRPTIRMTPRHEERNTRPVGWFDWNPMLPTDAVDDFFRGGFGAPEDSVVVHANWDNNPFFPSDLAAERVEDERRLSPEEYRHVWGGEYWLDDANQLIAYQWLMDARDRGLAWNREGDGSAPRLIVSVDVADGGADATVVTAKRTWDSFEVLLRQEKHKHSPSVATMRAADEARDVFDRYGGDKQLDEIHVDANGVGAGTAGNLIDAGYRVVRYVGGADSDNKKRFRNRRVQCHLAMRNAYRDKKIMVDPGAFDDTRDWKEFVDQMTMVRRRPGLERVEDLETKEHLVQRTGKSPDRAESHAISFSTSFPVESQGSIIEQVQVFPGTQYEGGIAA